MRVLIAFLHGYLSPFMTGACMAGATVAEPVPAAVALLLAAVVFGYASFPAGARMIERLAGISSRA